ncbi:MAG: hypothetical protein HY907_22845 [Deltaproteobacteria bacterium]|nr:hypothetical protein [Deltaproteobacteria bacterium]
MATDDLRERLERFRVDYGRSVEAGRALAAQAAPGSDVERWMRSCPPGVLAAARREQAALARELAADAPRPRPRPARPAGAAPRTRLTPEDFAVRTMER